MTEKDPRKRPNVNDLMNHQYFWSNDKKLKLIQDVSDKLEFNNQSNTEMIQKLEAVGLKYKVLASSSDTWNLDLHPTLVIILLILIFLDKGASEMEEI